jgi:CheY-like chemotaxis protein/signal transduction histidine kinase
MIFSATALSVGTQSGWNDAIFGALPLLGEASGVLTMAVAIAVPTLLAGAGLGWRLRENRARQKELRLRQEFQSERDRITSEVGNEVKRAQESVAASREELVGVVNQEIRTPLHSLMGYLDMLLETPLAFDQRELALAGGRSAEVLLLSLNDLFDYTRLEAGQLQLSPAVFDLGEHVVDVLELLSGHAAEKGIELGFESNQARAVMVEADPVRSRQVLVSLIASLIKLSTDGHLSIRLEPVEEASRFRVRCLIHRSGEGATRQTLARLLGLDPSPAAVKGREEPSLSLLITRKIVERMGGEVGVGDGDNDASEVWFTLPLADEGTVRMTAKLPLVGTGFRVLVIEPSSASRQLVVRHLEAGGFTVETITSVIGVTDRLRAVSAGRPPVNAVVFSEALADASGRTFAQSVRSEAAFGRVALICLRRQGLTANGAVLATLGVVEVTKPVLRAAPFLNTVIGVIHSQEATWAAGKVPTAIVEPPKQAIWVPKGFVLLAEDNDVNRRVMVELLRRLGWACDVVNDGAAAVAAATNKNYSLVLMDCHMPNMSGFESTRQIRTEEKNNRRKRTPIVGVTADTLPTIRERCRQVGMDDCFFKPVRRSELEECLCRWARPLSGN